MKCAIVLAVLLAAAAPGFASTTWFVDASNTTGPWLGTKMYPFQWIQDGINAAANGDHVYVMPGTYVEQIDFLGKDVMVTSAQGAGVTTIDGNQAGSVVTFQSGAGPAAVLEGFTVRNGHALDGGGIYCGYASPTITQNTIMNNSADNYGGGIYCTHFSSPTIAGNTIRSNTAHDGGGIGCYWESSPGISQNTIAANAAAGNGGGVFCYVGASPSISKNSIQVNQAFLGGGVYCYYYSNPVIDGNTFLGNAVTNGYGGGIFSSMSSTSMTNNVFKGNMAHGGGGLCLIQHIPPSQIANNTFFENSAQLGGGIACKYWSHGVITNTILWGDAATEGSEIWIGDSGHSSSLDISFSDVKGSLASVHTEPGCTLNWGAGMIETDPQFVNPAVYDFHLTWLSRCINMGTNTGAPPQDMDGEARPFMGTADLGADEFTGLHPLEADLFAFSQSVVGHVNFQLHGGTANANRGYLLLGSITGTAPGFPLGSTIVPLNFDVFTNLVLGNLNSPMFMDFLGTLDPMGEGTAWFDTLVPPWGAAGITFSFAYALNGPWDFSSNPVNVLVLP